jgi:hypothetical protein
LIEERLEKTFRKEKQTKPLVNESPNSHIMFLFSAKKSSNISQGRGESKGKKEERENAGKIKKKIHKKEERQSIRMGS